MNSNAHSVLMQLRCQARAFRRPSSFLVLISALVFASGCSSRVRPYTSKEAVDALSKQLSQVQTVRGRAWISVNSPEQEITFPASIAIDRSNTKAPKLRIEAMDPLGTTHALMIMRARAAGGLDFTSIDFDNRRILDMKDSWYGLPLAQLPELLLGLAPIPADGRVGAVGADGFDVRSGMNRFQFLMTWIDPGPHLALAGIEGEIAHGHRGKAEAYVVRYTKYLDTGEFYLPQEARLQSFAAGHATDAKAKPTLEVKLVWRERKWNETIDEKIFLLPKTDGFTREKY